MDNKKCISTSNETTFCLNITEHVCYTFSMFELDGNEI